MPSFPICLNIFIMNIIYAGFSDRQFFVSQDLKFSSVKTKRLPNSYLFFLFIFFFFYRLYFSAFTILNVICKTCSKSLIPQFLQCMHLPPFLFFPPTKNKKTRVASNFVVTLYLSLSIIQMGGGVCMLENFGKL